MLCLLSGGVLALSGPEAPPCGLNKHRSLVSSLNQAKLSQIIQGLFCLLSLRTFSAWFALIHLDLAFDSTVGQHWQNEKMKRFNKHIQKCLNMLETKIWKKNANVEKMLKMFFQIWILTCPEARLGTPNCHHARSFPLCLAGLATCEG